jgi:hypothetical protein
LEVEVLNEESFSSLNLSWLMAFVRPEAPRITRVAERRFAGPRPTSDLPGALQPYPRHRSFEESNGTLCSPMRTLKIGLMRLWQLEPGSGFDRRTEAAQSMLLDNAQTALRCSFRPLPRARYRAAD